MYNLHHEIRRKIILNNENYKRAADEYRHEKEFGEGEMVMVRIKPGRLPQGAIRKLHARNTDPFKVLKRIGPNAYLLDLPSDMGISSIFNVEDLILYYPDIENLVSSLPP